MRKQILILLAVILLAACSFGEEPVKITPSSSRPTAVATLPLSLPTTAPAGVTTPQPVATAVPPPTFTPLPAAPDLAIYAAGILIYPGPEIYAGEKASFVIMPFVPDQVKPENVSVDLTIDGQYLGQSALVSRTLSETPVAIYEWVWIATSGQHTVEIELDRENQVLAGDEDETNNRLSLPINVLAAESPPVPVSEQNWITTELACCRIHVVNGTAAFRDLPSLLMTVETAVQNVESRLNIFSEQPLEIYFVDRVIGQGGYAGSEMVVSYLDRDYSGNELSQVIAHEAVHLLDREIAPKRIAFLAEGVAVWASGGHYWPQNFDEDMAALLELNRYQPLSKLVNDFYSYQHETGYLEAASFVDYLITLNGWEQFRAFYSDVTGEDGDSIAAALDLNLQIYYRRSLAEMEREWLDFLQDQPYRPTAIERMETTLNYFDTMRQYQEFYDPAAYFRTAWLPSPTAVRMEGNPADLTRHPETTVHVTVEVMLQAAALALRQGAYNQTEVLTHSVNRILSSQGQFQDPLAASYQNLVLSASDLGYQVQQIDLKNNRAVLFVLDGRSLRLTPVQFYLRDQKWIHAE